MKAITEIRLASTDRTRPDKDLPNTKYRKC